MQFCNAIKVTNTDHSYILVRPLCLFNAINVFVSTQNTHFLSHTRICSGFLYLYFSKYECNMEPVCKDEIN